VAFRSHGLASPGVVAVIIVIRKLSSSKFDNNTFPQQQNDLDGRESPFRLPSLWSSSSSSSNNNRRRRSFSNRNSRFFF